MPEMQFRLRWPDGSDSLCYSPSFVIAEHFHPGGRYALADFLARSRAALHEASARVQAKYGMACSRALGQLADIERRAAGFAMLPGAQVTVLAFDPPVASPRHVAVAIVGGGQAGLSMSWHLCRQGIEHVVLERHAAFHAWRHERWDSFCLVTPNWQCRLPGFPYAGSDPDGFMLRDDIVAYVDGFRASFDPPLLEGVDVTSLRRDARGFVLATSAGTILADQVVVATGGYHTPIVPDFAEKIDAGIVQLHSSQYRRPAALPPGPVLVVGTGQSGCQIAEDSHLAGRDVHLAVGDAPRVARRYRGRDVVAWLDRMGYYDIPVDRHPLREGVRDKTNHYVTGRDGGRDIDLRARALEGMRLYGKLAGLAGDTLRFAPGLAASLDAADAVSDSIKHSIDAWIAAEGILAPEEPPYRPPWRPETEAAMLDLRAAGIGSIVWCIGFHADFSWIEAPVFDARGAPVHMRGVTDIPGLYFLGLPWLHSWGSGRFSGVARDAAHLAERVAARVVVPATAKLCDLAM